MTDHEPRRDLVGNWRAVEAASPGPSAALDARVRASLAASPTPRWPLAAAGLVTAAAAALIAFAPEPLPPTPEAQTTTNIVFSAPACAPEALTADLELAEGCSATLPSLGVTMTARARAVLRHSDRGVRLVRGEVRFDVQRRTERPFSVLTTGGRIDVLGTVFDVRADDDGGQVWLRRGRIEVVTATRRRTLVANEHAAWARPIDDAALDREVAQVHRLRSLGEGRAAAQRLERLLERPLDDVSAEVLSYELGLVLQADLQDTEAACRHWRAHAARFRDGRYVVALRTALESCPAAGNSASPRK